MTLPASKPGFGVNDLAEFRARLDELRSQLEAPTEVGTYVAYTDGACLGNPRGPGGWAAVMEGPRARVQTLLWGHLSSTSNNRAEALGVLAAIEWTPPGSRLDVHSDSELTVRILQGGYKAKANPDIWAVLRHDLAERRLKLNAEWVRGHAGDPRNELADRLTRIGAKRGRLDDLDVVEALPPAPADESAEALVGLEPRNAWEREFLSSVGEQLRRGRLLSPKQQAILDGMRARMAT